MAGAFGSAATPFIGTVALLAAMIFHVLAFAAPYWSTTESDGNYGLWRRARCRIEGSTDCYRYNMHWSVADWLNAVRGLECLTIIFWSVPLMILPVYIYVALGLHYRCLLGSCCVSVLVGSICNIIGAIIYGIQIATDDVMRLGWCLIICIIGGGLGFVSFIILLIATFNRPDFSIDRHYPSGFYVDPDRNKLYAVGVINDNFETLSVKSAQSNPPAGLVVVPQ
ncbi:hypothetical protein SNE40_010538 [Patella caerulea]|uniref:Uncharacterized protein n=1 Tax=Patella caerulea TaxID=87958 RepID=A0AAN8K192_PATCE